MYSFNEKDRPMDSDIWVYLSEAEAMLNVTLSKINFIRSGAESESELKLLEEKAKYYQDRFGSIRQKWAG